MDSKEDICLLALNQVKLDSDPGCKILERSAGSRSAGHVGSPQRETSRLIPRHRRKGELGKGNLGFLAGQARARAEAWRPGDSNSSL